VKTTIQKGIILFNTCYDDYYGFYFFYSLDGDNEEPENYSLEDIKTNLMVLDEKIADDMWFI
jgi:hypothetical protein